MCMNCGCGEYNERHKSSDITLDDLQKAAEGQNMDVETAADNIHQGARQIDQANGRAYAEIASAPGGSNSNGMRARRFARAGSATFPGLAFGANPRRT